MPRPEDLTSGAAVGGGRRGTWGRGVLAHVGILPSASAPRQGAGPVERERTHSHAPGHSPSGLPRLLQPSFPNSGHGTGSSPVWEQGDLSTGALRRAGTSGSPGGGARFEGASVGAGEAATPEDSSPQPGARERGAGGDADAGSSGARSPTPGPSVEGSRCWLSRLV